MSRRHGPRPTSPERAGRPREPARKPDDRTRAGTSRGRGSVDGRIVGAAIAVVAVLLLGAGALLTGASPFGPSNPSPGAVGSDASGALSGETTVQIPGGQRTDVTPDRLAAMLQTRDFTLLNVKTPYIGEIEGTDLYIPYDQLTARATELPTDHAARIVVYCRSGNESGIASQTLVALGYTNVYNLAGGMNAWIASGRSIVQRART